jgi:hypothetical protein
MAEVTPLHPMLAAALEYVERQWAIFPCHWITRVGACSCKKGAKCDRAGKHPRTQHGYLDASKDPEQIRRWWRENPIANIGLACGISRLIVVDCDLKNGGVANWTRLQEQHPELQVPTLEAISQSGGRHFFFAAGD